MDSKELILAGRLKEARKQLVDEVKRSPGNTSKRTQLFQVMLLLGEWDKAGRHLDALTVQGTEAALSNDFYRSMIRAEKEREKVYKSGLLPSFLPDAPPWSGKWKQAVELLAAGRGDEAEKLLEEIRSPGQEVSGTVNGTPFKGFGDTDTLLFSFLEAIEYDRYLLIPVESIRELLLTPPETLLDLIWAKASITTWEGLTMVCLLPVLYPDSSRHENDLVKMGKMTDWQPFGENAYRGTGQHVYRAGGNELPLLTIREIIFDAPIDRH